MTTLANSPPARLGRLQKLFVKLMFCEPTRVAYCQSPQSVLSEYDLSPDYQAALPDPDSEKFKVEAHGRRMRVFRETFGQFQRTIEMLDKNLAERGGIGQGPDFNAFLSSDAFTDPGFALPAPDGSGPGYENVSKFFFWVREVCGTSRSDAPIPLRTTLHAEFGAHLVAQSKTPCDPYFAKFVKGVMWRESPDAGPPWFVVTDQLKLGRLDSAPRFLPYSGLPDLDTVQPQGSPSEPNIRPNIG
jgi:hypothetical protein